MNPLLLVSIAISFAATFILTKRWIPVAKSAGIVGKDMNKPDKPEVAEMGGVAVLGGIIGGFLFYIGLNTFVFYNIEFNIYLFGTMTTVLIIAIIGIIDDLLGWKIGLTQLQKPVLTLPAALPMMVINTGTSHVNLPFIGTIDFGILYPLMLVPIGIVGASNGFNMLAGYNGLEAGLGIIIIFSIGILSYFTGNANVTMICLISVAALLAFMIFNWYPAKVFPGNCLTYMVGAIIACTAILANVESMALILFIPYFFEFLLKLKSKMKAENFGLVQPDGSIQPPYIKFYSLLHIIIFIIKKIKGKAYEIQVVISVFCIELMLSILGLGLYIF